MSAPGDEAFWTLVAPLMPCPHELIRDDGVSWCCCDTIGHPGHHWFNLNGRMGTWPTGANYPPSGGKHPTEGYKDSVY